MTADITATITADELIALAQFRDPARTESPVHALFVEPHRVFATDGSTVAVLEMEEGAAHAPTSPEWLSYDWAAVDKALKVARKMRATKKRPAGKVAFFDGKIVLTAADGGESSTIFTLCGTPGMNSIKRPPQISMAIPRPDVEADKASKGVSIMLDANFLSRLVLIQAAADGDRPTLRVTGPLDAVSARVGRWVVAIMPCRP